MTTTQATALLPCPFCGHDSPEFERLGTARQSCIVICGYCGARHESSDEGDRSGSSWNTRAALGVAATSAGAQPTLYLVPDDCPRDDFDQPIIYLTNEVNLVAHSLTGSEGEEDALTELKGMARYVSNVWTGKTALQVLLEYEEAALPSAKRVPLSDADIAMLRKGLRDWEVPENRYAAQRLLDGMSNRRAAEKVSVLPNDMRAPLTDEQLHAVMEEVNFTYNPTLFARAIEAAHGITESKEASHD